MPCIPYILAHGLLYIFYLLVERGDGRSQYTGEIQRCHLYCSYRNLGFLLAIVQLVNGDACILLSFQLLVSGLHVVNVKGFGGVVNRRLPLKDAYGSPNRQTPSHFL